MAWRGCCLLVLILGESEVLESYFQSIESLAMAPPHVPHERQTFDSMYCFDSNPCC